MAKVNPFALKRLHGVTETRTFADPLWPGDTVTLTLQSKPGTATQLSISSHSQAMQERFLAAGAMEVFIGQGDDKAAARITPEICQVIATIQILDVTPVADRYSFEEWVAFSELYTTAFPEIVQWAQKMLGRTDRDDIPNDSAAATAPPSLPLPTSTSDPILRWSTDGTPLTSASCVALESSAALPSDASDSSESIPDSQPAISPTI